MPPETLALAALVVAAAYVVFGLTGFGATVLALPLLAHLVPLKFAVALLLLLDFSASILLGARSRKGIRFDELGVLAPFMLAGMALGLTVLVNLSERPLLAALGVFVLAYAAFGFLRRGTPAALSRLWAMPLGFLGGMLSSLFGTGGVLYAIYTAGRIQDKNELRATTAASVLISSSTRIVLFGLAGLLSQDGLLSAAALLFPALLAGFALGSRLHVTVPRAALVRVIYGVLLVAGGSLLLRVS